MTRTTYLRQNASALVAGVLALLLSTAAMSADTSIAVQAEVPATLNLIDEDGNPFGSKPLEMKLNPATGQLERTKVRFRIQTNSNSGNFNFALIPNPQLTSVNHKVDLSIEIFTGPSVWPLSKFGSTETVKSMYPTFEMTPKGAISTPIELRFFQADNSPVPAGNYKGSFALKVTQEP